MARPRLPTNVLDARGAFVKHPERRRERGTEPQDSRPLGDPPAYLDAEMTGIWHEVVAYAPPGVLKAADTMLVETATRMLHEIRQLTEEKVTKDGDVVTIRKKTSASEVGAFIRCLTEMGLTPAARSKVKVGDAQPAKSGFDDL